MKISITKEISRPLHQSFSIFGALSTSVGHLVVSHCETSDLETGIIEVIGNLVRESDAIAFNSVLIDQLIEKAKNGLPPTGNPSCTRLIYFIQSKDSWELKAKEWIPLQHLPEAFKALQPALKLPSKNLVEELLKVEMLLKNTNSLTPVQKFDMPLYLAPDAVAQLLAFAADSLASRKDQAISQHLSQVQKLRLGVDVTGRQLELVFPQTTEGTETHDLIWGLEISRGYITPSYRLSAPTLRTQFPNFEFGRSFNVVTQFNTMAPCGLMSTGSLVAGLELAQVSDGTKIGSLTTSNRIYSIESLLNSVTHRFSDGTARNAGTWTTGEWWQVNVDSFLGTGSSK
ncbi:hypothetical protein [Corynebacterium casei]|uniref:hypothetical protein n=1 Tax=Corynebacterium casei TaxID=160386 RepID=UPI003FD680BA